MVDNRCCRAHHCHVVNKCCQGAAVRRLSNAQRTDLATAVEQLAWIAVRETLQLGPDAGPGSDLPDADLQQMWLGAPASPLARPGNAETLAAVCPPVAA